MISTQAPTRAGASLRRPPTTAPSATALARAALTTILSWDHRHRQRHALAELDDHLLRDIGLTRRQARMEVRKPVWRG